MNGSVLAIFIAPAGKTAVEAVSVAELEKGRGIVGDRYYAQLGTFSKKNRVLPDQEVTLIESEEIDEFNRNNGSSLDYGAPRRNIVTKGIRLNELVGRRFSVGPVVLEGMRLCEPCAHLARTVSKKVLPGLVHRAGLRAKILSAGNVAPSDAVTVLESETA
jgi:MOSC domain-containing protein YiiM